MPKRWCQCRGCPSCATRSGIHGALYDADTTGTLKCPRCQAIATTQRNARASSTSRGYGAAHRKAREQWAPVVASGQAQCTETTCLEPARAIPPGAPWDLAHNEDRTGWKGPAHARCNRADGGRSAHRSP